MIDISAFLNDHSILFERFDHPAVFTCEQAKKIIPDDMPGTDTKNLFLRDEDGKRHFIVMVGHEKRVDLRALSTLLGVKRLSFGSPERLQEYLGITPGAVSILGLVNDVHHAVECFIDEALWKNTAFRVHPLVNTASFIISREGIETFMKAVGHPLSVIAVP